MSGTIGVSPDMKSGAVGIHPSGVMSDVKTWHLTASDYTNSTAEEEKVSTSLNSSSATGQVSFSAVAGYTYCIIYTGFQQVSRTTGADSDERYWHTNLQLNTADQALGTTIPGGQSLDSSGMVICGGVQGGLKAADVGSAMTNWVVFTMTGSYYMTVTQTLYTYMTVRPSQANQSVRHLASDDYPSVCIIEKIKGNHVNSY
jgi:hypothetical protein